jgi:hypothetical protein
VEHLVDLGAARGQLMFVPNWTEHSESGGVN